MNQRAVVSAAEPAGHDFPASLAGVSFTDVIKAAEALTAIGGGKIATALYRDWIAANHAGPLPLFAAWFNLGVEYAKLGERERAIEAYRSALALRHDFHQAAINLGLTYEAAGQPQLALALWNETLQASDARVALLNNKGRLCEKIGDLQTAEATLRASLLIDPAQPDVVQHWVHVRQKLCLWPVLAEIIPALSASDLLLGSGPLGALALTDQVSLQCTIAARWIARKFPDQRMRLAPETGYGHGKIRVGYLSSDYCRHAMCYLIAQLFERHDRSGFEVYGYCSSLDDGSEIRRRVIAAFDHFRIIRDLPDEAAARIIRDDEIDILIDLNGLTAGTRLALLRYKPAPIQATYLGFIGPVPLPELDYIFADDFVIPAAVRGQYRPSPLTIAHNYQANDQDRLIGGAVTRHEVGLGEDRFLFCCFSNYYKITEAMFAAWMEILRQVENGVLWLVDDNPDARRNMCDRAAALGIDPDRLIFAARVGPEDYMARLGLADLFLDTFPYNAGTIASDAIRMNVPIVTLMGESFASRMAARFLDDLGAHEGTAVSLPDYVEKAVGLASDGGAREAYRAKFGAESWRRSIGDVDRFTREFEDTLRRIRVQSPISVRLEGE